MKRGKVTNDMLRNVSDKYNIPYVHVKHAYDLGMLNITKVRKLWLDAIRSKIICYRGNGERCTSPFDSF